MKFSIKDFFSKCNQIRSYLRIVEFVISSVSHKKDLKVNLTISWLIRKKYLGIKVNNVRLIYVFYFCSIEGLGRRL